MLFKRENTIKVLDKRRIVTLKEGKYSMLFKLKYLSNGKWIEAEHFRCDINSLKSVEDMTNLLLAIRKNTKATKIYS